MTADTYSSIIGWLDQGTGNNNNTWGDNCDLSVFPILERAITGSHQLPITGGTSDYSTSGTNPPNAAHMLLDYVQILSGTLTATHTIKVPNIVKTWRFINNTTGAFGVLIKTASGTAVNIPQGRVTDITCDGVNTCYRSDKDEVGTYDFTAVNVGGGKFECDGTSRLIADYPDLYAKIGTTFGGNGVTTFLLPDTYSFGSFLRSRTALVAVGTIQTELIKNHVHPVTGSVAISGSTGSDAADHTHNVNGTTGGQSADHSHSFNTAANKGLFRGTITPTDIWGSGNTGDNTSGTSGDHTHSVNIVSGGVNANHTHTAGTLSGTLSSVTSSNNTGGGSETRPANISAIVCIRY